jgi:hypothetical protein
LNKQNIIAIILIASVLFILPLSSAISASIGNSRMVLYPLVFSGEPTIMEKYIAVNNINDIDVKVELKPSEGFEDYVEIIDSNFVLKPEESKDARFNVKISEPGRYDGKIYVSFLPVEEQGNASGVGLASNIIIITREGNETTQQDTNPTEVNQNQSVENNISVPLIIALVLVLTLIIISYQYIKKSRGKKNE